MMLTANARRHADVEPVWRVMMYPRPVRALTSDITTARTRSTVMAFCAVTTGGYGHMTMSQ